MWAICACFIILNSTEKAGPLLTLPQISNKYKVIEADLIVWDNSQIVLTADRRTIVGFAL